MIFATRFCTVRVVLPVTPSALAVIDAVPGETAVTSPTLDTLATAGALEAQTSTRPSNVWPSGS